MNESHDLAVRRRQARMHVLWQDLEKLRRERAACEQRGDAEGVADCDRRSYSIHDELRPLRDEALAGGFALARVPSLELAGAEVLVASTGMDDFHISNGHGPHRASESLRVETEFVVRPLVLVHLDKNGEPDQREEPRLALAFWTGHAGEEECVAFGFADVDTGLGVARALQSRAQQPPFNAGPLDFADPKCELATSGDRVAFQFTAGGIIQRFWLSTDEARRVVEQMGNEIDGAEAWREANEP